jgi:hypothetical protein
VLARPGVILGLPVVPACPQYQRVAVSDLVVKSSSSAFRQTADGGGKGVRLGLQFLQLTLNQVFGVLRIILAKWPQSNGGTILRDDQKVRQHH